MNTVFQAVFVDPVLSVPLALLIGAVMSYATTLITRCKHQMALENLQLQRELAAAQRAADAAQALDAAKTQTQRVVTESTALVTHKLDTLVQTQVQAQAQATETVRTAQALQADIQRLTDQLVVATQQLAHMTTAPSADQQRLPEEHHS